MFFSGNLILDSMRNALLPSHLYNFGNHHYVASLISSRLFLLIFPSSDRVNFNKRLMVASFLDCFSGHTDFQMTNWDSQMNMNRKM